MTATCEWCGLDFRVKRTYYPARFCDPSCRAAAWRDKNHDQYNKAVRNHYKRNHTRLRAEVQAKRVGLLPGDIDAIRRFQDDACGSCGVALNGGGHVEHCHRTGVVRGITCVSCNNIIAKNRDSIPKLQARAEECRRLARLADCAAAYLAEPPAPKALLAIERALEEGR